MDKKDYQILYQLDLNCRQSNPQIARKLRLSPEVVYHRIKNLEKKGVIEYYYTTIDPTRFGYKAYRVYLKTQNLTIEKEKEIIEWLVNNKKTWWVLSIEGKWDIDILMWVKDDYDFEDFWIELNKKFRANIQSKLIQIYTRLTHFHRPYLINKKQDEEKEDVMFFNERVEIDKTDLGILKNIATNGRISLVELSKKIGISAKNISYRIKNLKKKKVILSFRAKINFDKINYRYYKIEVTLNDINRLREMYAYAKLHPNITYINQVIGLADFDADVEVQSEAELMKLFKDIRAKFGDLIREYDYFVIRKVYKISYIPEV